MAGVVGVASAAATIVAGLVWGARVNAPAEVGAPPIAASKPTELEVIDEPAPLAPIRASAAPEPIPAVSSAPQSSAVARPRPAAIGAPRISCDPPYSVDSGGIRHYKKGCLR
jgi:hypothetical protein